MPPCQNLHLANSCGVLATILLAFVAGTSGCGGDAEAIPTDATSTGETEAAAAIPGNIELGSFRIRDLKVVEAQSRSLNFTLHLTADESDMQRLEETVESRRQTIRNHVIVAVRSAEETELHEPGLERVARRVLLRLRRALGDRIVKGVFFSDLEMRIEAPG